MGRTKGWQPEKMAHLILALMSCAIIALSIHYGFGTFRRPGPGLFPFFVGLLMLVVSLILLFQTAKSKSREPLLNRDGIRTFLFMIGTLVLWIITMPYLGYPVVTLMATFSIGKIMKLEGWIKPASLAVGTALFIYILFDYFLYIDLPRGILG